MSEAKGPGATSHCGQQKADRTWQQSSLLRDEGDKHVYRELMSITKETSSWARSLTAP